METHGPDPKTDGDADPWEAFNAELGGLGQRLRDTYRKVADENGPTEDEIRDAFATLSGAWDQVAGTVGDAVRDPRVREHLKHAASSLAAALGATIGDFGTELRRPRGSEEE